MAAVKDHKNISEFTGSLELVEVTYDFSKDGGATGALDLLTAKQALVIHSACLKVQAAFTSGGSATYEVGVSGDTAGIIAQTAVASLTLGAAIDQAAFGSAYKLAADAVVIQTIATAAMTAGKGKLCLLVSKF